jgi:hypothetical protein
MTKGTNRPDLFKALRYLAVILIMISLSGISVSAQDLLKLKSGKEMKVTIVDEGADIIKYREFENPNGPVYSIGRDKVDSIKYKKGNRGAQDAKEKELATDTTSKAATVVKPGGPPQLSAVKKKVFLDGVEQSSRNIRLIMEDHPDALKEYESGRKMFTASRACPLVVIAITVAANMAIKDMPEQSDRMQVAIPVLCVDGAIVIAAIIFNSKGKAKLQKSVTLYNASINKAVQTSLIIGMQDNGVGLSLKF